jgi:SAM-dependent methyltransferase
LAGYDGFFGRMIHIMKEFPVKFLNDGRAMLNLACGSKSNYNWTNMDFSPIVSLAYHVTIARILRRIGVLSEARYKKVLNVDPDIIGWDLRKGIPFRDELFDVVYNSHFLEHLDLEAVVPFLKDIHRVLKNGGIVRIVVPDLQVLVNRYVSSAKKLERGDVSALNEHQKTIHDLFDQMVRKESAGTNVQPAFVRIIEKMVRGGPGKIGELHRWMYDKYTLQALLEDVGFADVREHTYCSSGIDGWQQFNLDSNDDGDVYKPNSVYIEGVKSAQI